MRSATSTRALRQRHRIRHRRRRGRESRCSWPSRRPTTWLVASGRRARARVRRCAAKTSCSSPPARCRKTSSAPAAFAVQARKTTASSPSSTPGSAPTTTWGAPAPSRGVLGYTATMPASRPHSPAQRRLGIPRRLGAVASTFMAGRARASRGGSPIVRQQLRTSSSQPRRGPEPLIKDLCRRSPRRHRFAR